MRKFLVSVNGVSYEVEVEEIAAAPVAPVAPAASVAPAAPAAPAQSVQQAVVAAGNPTSGESVCAPMPGTILEVSVHVGDMVKKGDVLCILEAMKLENEIMAAKDGKVAAINAVRGGSVNTGDVLLVIA